MGNALSRKIFQRGLMVVGGLLGTGVVGGGIFLSSLSSTGVEQKNDSTPAFLPIVIDITASGSTSATRKYDAFCIDSPLKSLGNGSGFIVRAVHHNVRNPAGASLDIGFVDDCRDKTASGVALFNNTCTGTGCTDVYTTGTLVWPTTGSGEKLKGTFSKDPTGWSNGADTGTKYDGKVTIWLEDILGE